VYDYIFVGMNQPLIGSFTIPVGELIHSIQREREEEIEEIREVIDGLQKIITGEVVIPSYNVKPPAAPGLDASLNREDEVSARESNALI
jgi:sugar phosphate isomerase/epimerase